MSIVQYTGTLGLGMSYDVSALVCDREPGARTVLSGAQQDGLAISKHKPNIYRPLTYKRWSRKWRWCLSFHPVPGGF